MPLVEWAAYAVELPALEAEASLARAEAAALPWMTAADRRRTLARLQRLISGPPDDVAPTPTALPIEGLAIRRVTKEGASS